MFLKAVAGEEEKEDGVEVVEVRRDSVFLHEGEEENDDTSWCSITPLCSNPSTSLTSTMHHLFKTFTKFSCNRLLPSSLRCTPS